MKIRAGFEPVNNSFAGCPLKPLEYRIMAGMAGFQPALPVSKAGALTAWLYPKILEIRAGLEPVITNVKGLCPNHLDERTVCRERPPCELSHRMIDYDNIIYANMQKCCKND